MVFGSGTGPRFTGTVLSVLPSARKTETWEITAVETPDGKITVNLPAELGVLNRAASLSGTVQGQTLVLLGDRSEDQGYLDSLVFMRLNRNGLDSAFAVVTRGDSATAAEAAVRLLKGHLRNVLVAEEAYFGDHVAYTSDFRRLQVTNPLGVNTQVRVIPDRSGYQSIVHVTAKHTSGLVCHIYVGNPAPVSGQVEGRPWCEE